MFKKFVAAICSIALAILMIPAAAFADSSSVVTIGADLTGDQRAQVLQFFGLDPNDLSDVQIVTVTNADEHRYCDASIPPSVTGSRTLSCAYIQPTNSGGINVRTANLNYVTSDMLYNALQTAGIRNCNLVVTAPYEVSGTGALTGVFMAYESTGHHVDSEMANVAVEEMYETAQLAEEYGSGIVEAISTAKDEVVSSGEDLTYEQIAAIIQEAAAEQGITLSDQDLQTLIALMQKLQSLDYDLDAFSNTLGEYLSQASGFIATIKGLIGQLVGLFSKGGSIINNLDTGVFSLD